MRLCCYPNAADAAVGAATEVAARLDAALAQHRVATLALSGGSTAPGLLAALGSAAIDWERVWVWQVDERVAPDGDDSRNARQLAGFPGHVQLMPVTDTDLNLAAQRYGATLPERLDVVHLGVGTDGHTASWPPDQPEIACADAPVVVTEPFNGLVRMTLTASVVNRARHRVVLAVGAPKAAVIARLVDAPPAGGGAPLPIGHLERADMTVVVDAAACQDNGTDCTPVGRGGGVEGGRGGKSGRDMLATMNAELPGPVDASLSELFRVDPGRAERYVVHAGDLRIDYSKHPVTDEVLAALFAAAAARGVERRRDAMFAGEHINVTEDRAVLHTALRAPQGAVVTDNDQNVVPDVHAMLARMSAFATKVRDDTSITDIVNIGIGGSDLGPAMASTALAAFGIDGKRFHFVSNIDGADIAGVLASVKPANTLFIVASKSFGTIETLTNATTAREWVVDQLGESAVPHHFVAVSSNSERVAAFGIDTTNMFELWDWVGGRYSIDSAIGLALMIQIGPGAFEQFLGGFRTLDEHFRSTPVEANAAMILGLIGLWHTDAYRRPTKAVLPYAQELARFPAYLQQLDMESNGKRVQLDGTPVAGTTGPVVWGEPGTNGQHAFYQLLHQGTHVVPVDFIGFANPHHGLRHHHDLLMSNLFAQSEALAFGRSNREEPYRHFPGDRPSTMILAEELNPSTLGQLIALYEHVVFVQGAMWGINSFDQWGVELGKELSNRITPELTGEAPASPHDPSTGAAIEWYRTQRHA